jgi:hypothetical protein
LVSSKSDVFDTGALKMADEPEKSEEKSIENQRDDELSCVVARKNVVIRTSERD